MGLDRTTNCCLPEQRVICRFGPWGQLQLQIMLTNNSLTPRKLRSLFGPFQSVVRSGQNILARVESIAQRSRRPQRGIGVQGLPWEIPRPGLALKGPLGRREPAPRPEGKPWAEWREDKVRMGWFLPGNGRWDSARFHPRTPTQARSLCYIALRSVERFVEMLPEGSSARPPLTRDGVSVA